MGLALIDSGPSRYGSVDCALISIREDKLADRLLLLYEDLKSYFDLWKPGEVAIEDIFAKTNLKTVVTLARVSGVIILLCRQRMVPVTLYPPATVKASVTGHGNASKEQVSFVVRNSFSLERKLDENVSDAYAVALCHHFALLNNVNRSS